jgi:hypothetical protein
LTTIVVNKRPDFLVDVSPIREDKLQKAEKFRFYYKGGGDTLAITKIGAQLEVYVPTFSSILADTVFKLVDELKADIDREMKEKAIPENVPFLFDTKTKIIITLESFVDMTPRYGIKKCLFLIDDDGSKVLPTMHYLVDQSDYGTAQFLCLMIAKEELLRPFKPGTNWSLTGRQLLGYLATHKYKVPASFFYVTGFWDSLNLDCTGDNNLYPNDDRYKALNSLNLKRARKLAEDLVTDESADESAWIKYIDKGTDTKKITLLDALQVGIDNFYKGTYSGVIELTLDTMVNKFRSITIDTGLGICFVELQDGVKESLAEVQSALESESIQICEAK